MEYLSIFFSLHLWMAMILSVAAGIVIGALPGLTPAVGVGLLVPVTFGMKPVTGLVILGGIYVGAVYGGAITAILLNTPGEPGNIATTFDGYPMARKGEPGRALGLAGIASTIGGIFSVVVLLLMAPPLAKIALKFGPAEYFAVAIFGLTVIVSFSQGALLKGVISAIIGLVLGIVGQDPIMGYPRFAFIPDLVGGVELIPCVIGYSAFLRDWFWFWKRKRRSPSRTSRSCVTVRPSGTSPATRLTFSAAPYWAPSWGSYPGPAWPWAQ